MKRLGNKEILAGILILVAVVMMAAYLFLCWYSEQKNVPVKQLTTTREYNHDVSDGETSKLVLEEGPGYKRMQFFFRVTMGLTQESESIYTEVER